MLTGVIFKPDNWTFYGEFLLGEGSGMQNTAKPNPLTAYISLYKKHTLHIDLH